MPPILRRKDHEVGFIYFFSCPYENGEAVKIGFAQDVKERQYNLQTSLPYDLRIEASFAGTKADEAILHTILKDHHIKREWYYLSDEVWEFIEDLEDAANVIRAKRGIDHNVTMSECLAVKNPKESFDEIFLYGSGAWIRTQS